jgi:phytoene desaturase
MSKKIAVVGAGVGGTATAARLAKKGYDVDVYERLTEVGGRAHLIEDKGFKFDTGPSFVMMPAFFEEFFDSIGEDIKDHLDLKRLDKHYKIFYPNGETFTVFTDEEKMEAELERIEKGSAQNYRKFKKEIGVLYKYIENLFHHCFTPPAALHPKYWDFLTKLRLGKSYWSLFKDYFKSDILCYAFTFEAMFIGVSPFECPGFYSVITYTDHVHKIFHPMGGMYKIPSKFEQLAKKNGAKFHYGVNIDSIEKKGAKFILKSKKGQFTADKVVINADYSNSKEKLLKRKLPKYDYSCSVFLMYWGMKQKINNLEHHNLFFAKDLKQNMENIFKTKVVSDDFSFYVHVPTVTDQSLAPEGRDILYTLVPVPNLENSKDFKAYEQKVKKIVIDRLRELSGQDIESLIDVEHYFYPEDFLKRYNIKHGATFGLAHTFWQSGFFRPVNFDNKLKGLYYVGASTQPGGGLPPVIASSKIAADLVTKGDS